MSDPWLRVKHLFQSRKQAEARRRMTSVDPGELRYRVRRQPILIALDNGTLTAADLEAVEPEIVERIISEECDRWPQFLAGRRYA